MSRRPDSDLAERRGYHHGRLREALLEAARRLIAERGPAGFTLSDAAKIAGVSPAAPYRHFKDRQALLQAVAEEGFVALGRRLAEAARGEGGFLRMGQAYLGFARDEPAYYAAMFNTGAFSRVSGSESGGRDGDSGFGLLQAAVGRQLGRADPAEAERAAELVFALTHGLASLAAAGLIRDGWEGADRALDQGVAALMRGLGGARSQDNPGS